MHDAYTDSSDLREGRPVLPELAERRCPECGHDLRDDDFVQARMIALCWGCGKFWTYDKLIPGPDAKYVPDIANPPPGAYFTDDGLTQRLGGTTRQSVGWFLLLFGTFWGGGFMFGIYGTQILDGKFDLEQSLIGLFPLAITAVLLYFGLFYRFGRSEAVLTGSTCTVFTGVGPVGWRKTFDTAAVTSVVVGDAGWSQNKKQMKAVIITAGETIKFGSSLPDANRDFVFAVLKKLLMK